MQLNTLIRYMLERVFKKPELGCQFRREQICKIKQFFVSKTQQVFPLFKEWTLKCKRFISEESHSLMRHCIQLYIKQESTNQKYENQGDVFCFNLFHARNEQSYRAPSHCAITVASANNTLLKKHHKHFQNNCLYLEKETFGHSTLSTFKYYSCLLEMCPLFESECSTQLKMPLSEHSELMSFSTATLQHI